MDPVTTPTPDTEVLQMDEVIQFNPNTPDDPTPPATTETPSLENGGNTATIQAQAPPAATQTPAQQQAMVGLREAVRTYGLDLSQFQDDAQALSHLVRLAQSNDYYANLGRAMQPHQDVIRQAIAQRNQPQPQAQSQRQPWERPEFDQRWLNFVERGEDGIIRAKAGVDPSIANKVQSYYDWVNGFAQDPLSVLEPYLEHRMGSVPDQVEQIVNQRLAAMQEQQAVQNTLAQRADILYQRDTQGNIVLDPYTRRPQVSPTGMLYYQAVQQAHNMGIRSSVHQDQYAIQQLQLHLMLSQQGQTPGATTPAPGQVRLPNQTHPNVSGARTLTEPTRRQVVPGSSNPNAPGLSLEEQLRRAMDSEGITDNDFANIEMGG